MKREMLASSRDLASRVRLLLIERKSAGAEVQELLNQGRPTIADPIKNKQFSAYVEMWQAAERMAFEAADVALGLLDGPNSEMSRAFSPRTLAKRWMCSEHHIRNLGVSGELPGWRAGGKLLRISREAVEAYERRSASTEPNEERH